jgi:hypothetical protein
MKNPGEENRADQQVGNLMVSTDEFSLILFFKSGTKCENRSFVLCRLICIQLE